MGKPPAPQPGILDVALYQGGASALPGVAAPLKLSSNESPYGPPPSALAAARDAASAMHRYPPTDHARLRAAIAKVHGLDPARIVCGVGSDEIIHLLCQAYAGPGLEVMHTAHGFLMYAISARAAGATPVAIPERERRVDVDALLAAVGPATRIVFVTNPANPAGTLLPVVALRQLAEGLPDGCLLVLDGAYAEFANGDDCGLALAAELPHVLAMRTFSKAYGLGGLRVGWATAAQDVIDVLNRVRGPFNLSVPALAAAEAAMRDRAALAAHLQANAAQRARLTDGLRALGLAVDDSAANFVLARFPDGAAAEAANGALKRAGILVRHVANYGFPEGLRVTVGRPEDVDRVLAALAAHLDARAA